MDFWSDDDKYNDYHDNNLKFVTHNKDNPNNGLFQAFSEVKWSPICGMIWIVIFSDYSFKGTFVTTTTENI